jgi:hypothetical protein
MYLCKPAFESLFVTPDPKYLNIGTHSVISSPISISAILHLVPCEKDVFRFQLQILIRVLHVS